MTAIRQRHDIRCTHQYGFAKSNANEREHYKLVRNAIRELEKHGICYCFNQEQRDDIINGFRGLATWKLIDEICYIKEVE